MKHWLLASIVGFASVAAAAEPVVIVNPKNPNKVSVADAKDIFDGKSRNFADGTTAVPLALKSGKTKEQFLADVLGKTESQYRAAWTQRVFTGKGQPPKELESEEEIKKMVAANPTMIGYIDRAQVDASVKEIGK